MQQSSSQPSSEQIEEARRQIGRLAEEIAQIADKELNPADFFGEFLQRIMTAVAAPAGAVWTRTPQGNLQLQYQINMRQVGIDRTEQSRAMHDELLRQTAAKAQPALVMPHSSIGPAEGNFAAPGNPTDLVILMAPMLNDKNLTGLVEIWQDPNRGLEAQRGFLNFIVRMTAYAANYTRNYQLRQMVGKEQVWVQLESFVRQIHGTLNPVEAAYLVVNEGRRLLEADRISIAVRQPRTHGRRHQRGRRGRETFESRPARCAALFDAVIEWGEKLVFTGVKDDSLPPKVYKALDEYLAESNSKLLVVQPLIDERDTKNKAKARSALMVENFEITTDQEQQFARLEVIARHATPALYNAAEYRRIPMRFIWMPIAKVQDGLGGKTKAIITSVAVGLGPLHSGDALRSVSAQNGLQWPASHEGAHRRSIRRSPVKSLTSRKTWRPGVAVAKDVPIVRLYDSQLGKTIRDLNAQILAQDATIDTYSNRQGAAEADNRDFAFKVAEARIVKGSKNTELQELILRTGAVASDPGLFEIKAPISGIILSTDFRETFKQKTVRPNEPILTDRQRQPAKPQAQRLGSRAENSAEAHRPSPEGLQAQGQQGRTRRRSLADLGSEPRSTKASCAAIAWVFKPSPTATPTTNRSRSSAPGCASTARTFPKNAQLPAQAASERHRSPRPHPLRRPADGVLAVLWRLGIPVRENILLLLRGYRCGGTFVTCPFCEILNDGHVANVPPQIIGRLRPTKGRLPMGRFFTILVLAIVIGGGAAWQMGLLSGVSGDQSRTDGTGPTQPAVDLAKLGESLYVPQSPANPLVNQERRGPDPVVVGGTLTVIEKMDACSRIPGQILFVGQEIPDGTAQVAGVAPLLQGKLNSALVNLGDMTYYTFYQRLAEGDLIGDNEMVALIDPAKAIHGILEKITKLSAAAAEENSAFKISEACAAPLRSRSETLATRERFREGPRRRWPHCYQVEGRL